MESGNCSQVMCGHTMGSQGFPADQRKQGGNKFQQCSHGYRPASLASAAELCEQCHVVRSNTTGRANCPCGA